MVMEIACRSGGLIIQSRRPEFGDFCLAVFHESYPIHVTLIAFKLTFPTPTLKHQDIPGAKGVPPQGVDTCTMTPAGQSLPSLTITAVKLPAGATIDRPLCNAQTANAMEIATCTATIRDTFVSLTMLAKSSPTSTMRTTLATQVERLASQQAVPGPARAPR
ncbi:hypothetical protein [Duganella sp. Root1480D1]|uniref:hypothetical protein n=1 Tax=Duganella sp. Root1480D1 TaxID=1736471 RepID=UPI00070E6733|nr:hypothetical protein [Duganella sp. Root1480D1]KQZ42633.1 hypothetical protein ASD58_25100 [Duganella sp. Root1480D1]